MWPDVVVGVLVARKSKDAVYNVNSARGALRKRSAPLVFYLFIVRGQELLKPGEDGGCTKRR